MTLQIRELDVRFGRKHHPAVRAVAGVDLTVEPGQIVGLVGESGCGKSTLAKAAVGLLDRHAGTIDFNGIAVDPLGRHARDPRLQRIQMVFQDPYASLNPRRKVGKQITDGFPRDVGDASARIAELLGQVGLPAAAADRYPFEFSGGQRQRIAIARALAAEPEIIIADEAVSALDASTQAQVANLLVSVTRRRDAGMLFISHDLGIVRHISDVVAVMYLGTIVELGPTDAVWSDPQHPYTRALIDAVPLHDGSGTMPVALEGEVPDPARPPSGCRFHPRCPLRIDRCSAEVPAIEPVADGHLASCFVTQQQVAISSPKGTS